MCTYILIIVVPISILKWVNFDQKLVKNWAIFGLFWPIFGPVWTRVRSTGPGPTLDPGTRVLDPGLDALDNSSFVHKVVKSVNAACLIYYRVTDAAP